MQGFKFSANKIGHNVADDDNADVVVVVLRVVNENDIFLIVWLWFLSCNLTLS